MVSFLKAIFSKILATVYFIPSSIYDLVISNFLTKYSYERLVYYVN